MPRVARKYKKASFFHVITQGINKEYILKKERYIYEYLKLFRKYSKELDVKTIAYCIMNNHTHFLLKVEKIENLSKLMQKVNSLYARYYNYMENNRVGYVFRDRYVSEPIDSKKYLIQCIKYIHMNPVKAKIVERVEDYKFSSYKFYLRKLKNKNSKDEILSYQDYEEICNQKENEIDFFDIDIEKNDKVIYSAISRFLKENKIEIYEIFLNRENLKDLILYLKEKEHIKYIEIRRFFEIKRGTMEGLKTCKNIKG